MLQGVSHPWLARVPTKLCFPAPEVEKKMGKQTAQC